MFFWVAYIQHWHIVSKQPKLEPKTDSVLSEIIKYSFGHKIVKYRIALKRFRKTEKKR
jgi:hypothetical protein